MGGGALDAAGGALTTAAGWLATPPALRTGSSGTRASLLDGGDQAGPSSPGTWNTAAGSVASPAVAAS